MKFGYACLNMTTKLSFKTCRLATVQQEGLEKVKDITLKNLSLIKENIEWSIANNIFFYRFTSNVIPFATHDIMKTEIKWNWYNDPDVVKISQEIKNLVLNNNFRLTVHPGQHSPLNAQNMKVLINAMFDFHYHDRMLTMLGGTDMITHVGGAYGDKESAKMRFVQNYSMLTDSIKQKIRLENDDKIFTVEDVLEIHEECGVPICLDIHHHNCNSSSADIKELFPRVVESWKGFGTPKTHISSGKTHKFDRTHADYVERSDLEEFLSIIGNYDVDIMFESKMKELSVLRVIDLQKTNV